MKARPAPTTTLVLAALGLSLAACGDRDRPPGAGGAAEPLPPFPPPGALPEATVTAGDFVGAEACADCHAGPYEAWRSSTHGRAGGSPSDPLVIAPFPGAPMLFRDAEVTPRVREGRWEFAVRQVGHDEVVYPVDGVVGGGHMLGGGTQGFVSRMADGTARFLPFDWSDDAEAWFCNTGTRLDAGWVPVTPDLALADCGDWPPIRVLGTVERYANCQECHGSQILASLDTASAAYRTDWTSLRVNCESCHGPGRAHVERARAAGAGGAEEGAERGDLAMPSLAFLDKDASLELCFRCHALKDVIRPGYLPGDPLEAWYALKLPMLGDQPYTADFRVRTFAYQATHLSSACYLDGPMDCVSCHEPHGQGYRDTDLRPLDGPFDDGQCTSCHPSKAVDPPAHTFHPAGSEGSRCVACHMPYLQHPEVGEAIPFARSDHTIPVPRPGVDEAVGVVSACAGCHEASPLPELEAAVRAWWGELRPHRPAVAGLLAEAEATGGARPGPEAAGARLLHPGAGDPMAQFQGLARMLDRLSPDAPLPPSVATALDGLARDPDLDVRALALATLHWTRGDDPTVRRALVEALEEPGAAALRGRWILVLGFLGDRARDGGRAAEARRAYEKALQLDPGNAGVLAALGLLHNRSGAWGPAVDAFRRSLDADPARPLTWVNLGIALNGLGDAAGAEAAYGRALALDAREPLALFNLGNMRLREGDLAGAEARYRAAVEAAPGMAPARFNLARTLIQAGRYAEALPHARRAVEFAPEDAGARQMLADLEAALGGGEG